MRQGLPKKTPVFTSGFVCHFANNVELFSPAPVNPVRLSKAQRTSKVRVRYIRIWSYEQAYRRQDSPTA